MAYGDIALGSTYDDKFYTVDADGAPITLAGSPVISAYVGNSTTQITAGITLTVDFDGVTGLHHVRVVASGGNGYAAGTNVNLVITTGTVDGTSVVGYTVGSFSIENRSALRPTTAARTLDVSATGEAGLDWANVGSPTTTLGLSGTTVGTATTLTNAPSDSSGVTTLLSRIPSGLFTGITSLAQWLGLLAGKQTGNSTARTELRATGGGSGTYDETTDSQEALRDNVGTNGAALSLAKTTNITGFNDLSAAQVNTEADTALADAGVTTTVTGRIDAAITSRLASGSYTAPPSAGAIADQVWQETLSDHSGTSGSTAAALNAAGSAGDPWSTALPGSYGAGTAGKIIGDNINATVGSRATQTSVDTLAGYVDTEVAAIKAKTDNLPAAPAAVGDIPSAATTASAVRTNLTTELGRIDAAVSSRLATGTVASDLTAVKAKSDKLTFDASNRVEANTTAVNDVALTGDGSSTPWGPA